MQRQLLAIAKAAGIKTTADREKERLQLKRQRLIRLYREGYITDGEFEQETSAVVLALRDLDAPAAGGVKLEEIMAALDHLPGMAILWEHATVQERREVMMMLLEPEGLYYDLERKYIAAIKPRLVWMPLLSTLDSATELNGLLVMKNWQACIQHDGTIDNTVLNYAISKVIEC